MKSRSLFLFILKNTTIFIGLIIGAFVTAHLSVTARAFHKVGFGSPSAAIQAEIFSASSIAISHGLFYGIILFSLIAIYSKPINFISKAISLVCALALYFSVRWGLIWLLDAQSGEPTITSLVENRERASSVSFLIVGIIQGTLLYLLWTKTKRR